MNGVLTHADSAEALLILLLAGHFLGDFLLQGWRTAAGRARASFPARHVGIMIVAHIVTVIPFASWAVAGAVLGIGLLHGAVDAVKSRWPVRSPGRLGLFLLDQFAHVALVLLAWLLLREFAAVPPLRIPDAWLEPWLWTAVVLASFALNAAGGSAIVTGVLDGLAPGLEEAEDSGVAGSGRLIGILERTITVV